ncbi:FabD lysophospholipase-like protein, partial [Mycena latifolia]
MSNNDATCKGVRVLSLDGGGAGVLSELLILEQIMYQVQAALGSNTTPAPCDYFEVIGGSGTGGIIALMLGRLRMSIPASISAYEKLRPKPKSGSTEQFKAGPLEAVLRQIFREEKMRDVSPHACKTNYTYLDANPQFSFRSYDTPEEPAFDCKIWEAARATSATPGLFKPMEIGSGGVRPRYIGGCVGHNNPTSLVVAEAQKMYPSQPVVLVVSIGSGHPDTIQIPRSPSLTAFALTLKSIAADCERGFEQQHWGRSGEVSAHTRAYLSTEDAKSKLTGTVEVILNPVVPMSDSPAYLKVVHPRVSIHWKRGYSPTITEYFNTSIGQQHIFLLHGLGGSGKSQIAFKFVQRSTSVGITQTIENDLATLALAKKVGKTFQDSLLWLSNQQTEWLIVFNNADDVNLVQYFPSGSHGNILVTSRNPDLRQLAQATHKVEQMALEEATNLLLSAAQYDMMEVANRDVGKRIVQ